MSNTGRRRDPSTGVARRTYSTCWKTRTCAKVFSARPRARFPSNQPASTTGHLFRRSFTTSMEHTRVERWSNGGATIQTRFLSYGMNRAECKVFTRQSWHRRFTKMCLRETRLQQAGQKTRPPLSGCGVDWIATREKGRHLARLPAGSTSKRLSGTASTAALGLYLLL